MNDLFIIWIFPLPSNSRHQDHCITFLLGNPYKPLFAIGILRGSLDPKPLDFNQHDHKKQ